MSLNPGRLAAARALLDVEEGGRVEPRLEQVKGVDGALARHLAMGVLRHRCQLDALINPHVKGKLDRSVRSVLRIGAFELVSSRTATHAAVDQAVELTRRLRKGRASGLVNAVLRKVQGQELPALPNHPDWIVKRWTERVGEQAALEWLARLDEPSPLSVCLKDPSQGWPGGTPALVQGQPVPGVFHLRDAGRVPDLPGFDQGSFWVMDPASAAVADLVGAAPGMRVLDACAAPGGKTMRLASQGAEVTATDRSKRRLHRLEENLERVQLTARVCAQDWTRPCDLGLFDAVLVDAPCTSLGTTRRHPEVRWSRKPTDLLAMSLIQEQVLAGAAQQVAPGGVLVYAVCSPEPEEGSEQVAAFLAAHAGYVLETELLTAPPAGDEDAFYAARMARE